MKYFSRIFFSILLSYALLDTIRDLLNYGSVSWYSILLISVISILFFCIIFLSRQTIKYASFILSSILIIISFLLYLYELLVPFWNNIIGYFKIVYLSLQGVLFVGENTFIITMVLSGILINLLLYILIVRKKRYLIISLILLLFYSLVFIINEDFNILNFYITLFVALFMYFEFYFSKYYTKKSFDYTQIIYSIPTIVIFILVLLTLSTLFSRANPDALDFVDDIVDSIQSIELFKKSSDSNSKETVITYNTDIANSISHSSFESTDIMVVNSPDNYHLRSQTYNTYNGTNWTNEISSSSSEYQITDSEPFVMIELFQNILGYHYLLANEDISNLSFEDFMNLANEYFQKREISLSYRNVKTKSIFAPRNVYSINPKDIIVTTDQTNILKSTSELTEGFEISYNFFEPKNKNTLEYKNLMRKTHKDYYRDNNLNAYYEYNKFIYDNYTSIPNDMPNRVIDLSKEITSSYDNIYDKVKAIEQYLSKEYEYTLDTEPFDENKDFVDSFLFETKKGYCTYYASAMVIMVRALGIPARYVRGYILPAHDMDLLEEMRYQFDVGYDPNRYVVKEENAHTWVEVYLEGYGWSSFEPTKVYYDDYNPDIIDFDSDIDPSNREDQKNAFDKILPALKIAGKVLLILILLFLIASPFMYRYRKKLIYESMNQKDKVISTYDKIQNLLMLLNLDMNNDETPMAFARRVQKNYYLSHISYENVINIFYKARYGNKDIDVFELSIVESFYSDAHKEILSYANKLKIAIYYLANRI